MSTQDPRPTPPSLSSLTARFLSDQSLAPVGPVEAGVELHEAPTGFRTDTRTTWAEAVLAAKLGLCVTANVPPPSGWPALSRSLPGRHAIPLCVGNFPQLLGDMTSLFDRTDLTSLATVATEHGGDAAGARLPKGDPCLVALTTAAGHRLAGEYDAAVAVLAESEALFTSDRRAAWENERAAVEWARGRRAEAVEGWRRMPDGALKAFNLGMAELFAGRPATARDHLIAACAGIPETSGWSHLARLYLALCDSNTR